MSKIDLEKTEYNYLLGFFLNLAQFEPTTSTFFFLEEVERKELNLTIGVLQRKLSEVMPRVQDRESNAANKTKDIGSPEQRDRQDSRRIE